MSVSAKDVQELRRRTGAGLMDCKKALVDAAGDQEEAIKLLKERGIAKAAKKGGREATEGVLVAVISDDLHKGALIEVNCETDFVANTDEYKAFAKATAEHIFKKGFAAPADLDEETENKIKEGIAKFGENILVNSIKKMESKGALFSYIHSNFKTGTMIGLESSGGKYTGAIEELGKDLAVHTTANQVVAISEADIDPKIIEAKKNEYAEEVKASGKPANIVEKIVSGKMSKFFKDETLFFQPFLKNEEISVKEHVEAVGKKAGVTITLTGFIKSTIGE